MDIQATGGAPQRIHTSTSTEPSTRTPPGSIATTGMTLVGAGHGRSEGSARRTSGLT